MKVKLADLTPEGRRAFFRERQKKAAATRRANLGDDVFKEMGKKGGRPTRKNKGRPM